MPCLAKTIPTRTMNSSRIENILESFPPDKRKAVMELRERHACIMELDKARRSYIMRKALLQNYIAGEGRRKLGIPRHIKDDLFKREVYFSYIK